MPKFGKIEIFMILGGIVMAALGVQWSINILVAIGIILLGVGLLIGGVSIIIRRGGGFWHSEDLGVWLRGIMLWSWGIVWIIGGVWAIIIALVRLVGLGAPAQEYIFRRPGILILSIGVALLSQGISNMFEGYGNEGSKWAMLRTLPRRFGGFLIALLALVLIGLGIFEIIAPSFYDTFFSSIFRPFF